MPPIQATEKTFPALHRLQAKPDGGKKLRPLLTASQGETEIRGATQGKPCEAIQVGVQRTIQGTGPDRTARTRKTSQGSRCPIGSCKMPASARSGTSKKQRQSSRLHNARAGDSRPSHNGPKQKVRPVKMLEQTERARAKKARSTGPAGANIHSTGPGQCKLPSTVAPAKASGGGIEELAGM